MSGTKTKQRTSTLAAISDKLSKSKKAHLIGSRLDINNDKNSLSEMRKWQEHLSNHLSMKPNTRNPSQGRK